MNSRPASILVCLMITLCPAFCTADAAVHCDHHAPPQDASSCADTHEHDNSAHHEHGPDGVPQPHTTHTCICTGESTPVQATQVPGFAPAIPIFAAANDCVTIRNTGSEQLTLRFALDFVPPDDVRTTPLLI